ncbi:hypothetical protein ACNKHS_00755 [Shigella flexneri]
MLDNSKTEQWRSRRTHDGKALLEVSGNVTDKTLVNLPKRAWTLSPSRCAN